MYEHRQKWRLGYFFLLKKLFVSGVHSLHEASSGQLFFSSFAIPDFPWSSATSGWQTKCGHSGHKFPTSTRVLLFKALATQQKRLHFGKTKCCWRQEQSKHFVLNVFFKARPGAVFSSTSFFQIFKAVPLYLLLRVQFLSCVAILSPLPVYVHCTEGWIVEGSNKHNGYDAW